MRIPIGDYPLTQADRDAVICVLDSGRISEHREVRAFEDEFARYVGTNHCVAVNSGTSALICGLRAMVELGCILPQSNVLVPALTFVATANAVRLSDLEVQFADVDPDTLCLDPWKIPFNSDIKLILPVHLLGYVADMGEIIRKGEQIRAAVAEDAAEAHGSIYFGQQAGSFGLWSAFSFYIAHTVQAGELGAVCTNDSSLAEAVRSIKAHGRLCTCRVCVRGQGKCPKEGQNPRFTSQYVGYNFKPMEFQAALARVQLSRIKENIELRKENEYDLMMSLKSLVEEGLINSHYFCNNATFRNVPMVFPIVLRRSGRDTITREVERVGIECRPLFGCIPTQQPSYNTHPQHLDRFPISEYYGSNGFYVGCHQYISKGDIHWMGQVISDVIRKESR